jgi:hypothetical protein
MYFAVADEGYRIPAVQLSSVITESPVSLFLGAGASQPLGKPTMQPFVYGLGPKLSGEKLRELLKHLVSKCGEDLEQILAELDAITNLKSSEMVYGSYANSQHNMRELAPKLRTAIEYEIIQTYSVIQLPQLLSLYSPLFDLVFSGLDQDKCCLPVFTTNYDPAIEDFCDARSQEYDLIDGFVQVGRQYVWDAKQFHSFKLNKAKRNVVLFKLHGSVDWLFVKRKKAIVRTEPFHQMVDEERYKNVLIYPAVHKVATDEPYFTAYDYYGRCCERSKILLTIGYSFRDYDALARLRSAMSFNSDLKVVLLAPDARAILAPLPLERERLVEVDQPFGSPVAMPHVGRILETYKLSYSAKI